MARCLPFPRRGGAVARRRRRKGPGGKRRTTQRRGLKMPSRRRGRGLDARGSCSCVVFVVAEVDGQCLAQRSARSTSPDLEACVDGRLSTWPLAKARDRGRRSTAWRLEAETSRDRTSRSSRPAPGAGAGDGSHPRSPSAGVSSRSAGASGLGPHAGGRLAKARGPRRGGDRGGRGTVGLETRGGRRRAPTRGHPPKRAGRQ